MKFRNFYKNPFIVAVFVGAFLMILGSITGDWFKFKEGSLGDFAAKLTADDFGDQMKSKQNVTIGVAIFGLIMNALMALYKKRFIPILSILTGAFVAFMIFNQLPDKEEKDLLSVTVTPQYWISFIGSLVFLAGNILVMFKPKMIIKAKKA